MLPLVGRHRIELADHGCLGAGRLRTALLIVAMALVKVAMTLVQVAMAIALVTTASIAKAACAP
ncbi:hypothetical protein CU110_09815 [Cobetia sp. ICG0124]|nr:hypothetical protein CU110_09815 [Cobetia sp. ICG0124]